MVFDQDELEEVVMNEFSKIFEGKRHPVYPTNTPLDQNELSIQEINQILSQSSQSFKPDHFEEEVCPPFTFTELEQTLASLQTGKDSGYDKVPNELLKNSSFNFNSIYLYFLTRFLMMGLFQSNLIEANACSSTRYQHDQTNF